MFKIITFFTLVLIILLLIRKLMIIFIKNDTIRHILYLLLIFTFILLVFLYRERTLQNNKGIYAPPKFNGDRVIPGRVIDE